MKIGKIKLMKGKLHQLATFVGEEVSKVKETFKTYGLAEGFNQMTASVSASGVTAMKTAANTNDVLGNLRDKINNNPALKFAVGSAVTMGGAMVFKNALMNTLGVDIDLNPFAMDTAYAAEVDPSMQIVDTPDASVVDTTGTVEVSNDVNTDTYTATVTNDPVDNTYTVEVSAEPVVEQQVDEPVVEQQVDEPVVDNTVEQTTIDNQTENNEVTTEPVVSEDTTLEPVATSEPIVGADFPTEEPTLDENIEQQEETPTVEEMFLDPEQAVDGVDISDPSSSQGEVKFDANNTNTIVITDANGNKIVWTDQSYGNPNQALIEDNLINSGITNVGEGDFTFVSEFDYTDPETGLSHCVLPNGGELVYDPANGTYTVTYDKSLVGGTMGVELSDKEVIDPDEQEPVKPTEPPVTEPPVTEPPVTEPPVTEPPVTEPPVTEPPVTEPPVTEPTPEQTQQASNSPETGDEMPIAMGVAGVATVVGIAKVGKHFYDKLNEAKIDDIPKLEAARDALREFLGDNFSEDFVSELGMQSSPQLKK